MDLRLKHYKLMVSNLGNNRTSCKYSSVSASVPSKPTSHVCHSLGLLPISPYVHAVKDSPLYYIEKTEATFTPPIRNPLALHPHHDYRAFPTGDTPLVQGQPLCFHPNPPPELLWGLTTISSAPSC